MKVRKLLTEKNWVKKALAKDKNDCVTVPWSPDAVGFCLIGAIYKCYGVLGDAIEPFAKISMALNIAFNEINGNKNDLDMRKLADFNDNPKTTFEDIKMLVEALDI